MAITDNRLDKTKSMFATNVIFVEDCPNSRSHCTFCKAVIPPLTPRLRTTVKGYCHLTCYRPAFPVTILSDRDVQGELTVESNRKALTEWVEKWNQQFCTRGVEAWGCGTQPKSGVFRRELVEAFKYLTHGEICLLVGMTCKSWYYQSWTSELWLTLISRDFPLCSLSIPLNPRIRYLHLLSQCCLACHRIAAQPRVVCPVTKKPICVECFQKPGSSVFLVKQYATLMGVSADYLREACVPVYSYNSNNWVFSHLADVKLAQYRSSRRSLLLSEYDQSDVFSNKDLAKIKSLNLARAKYIGAILKHRFKGEEDLIDLLKFVFSGCEYKGNTVAKLLKRNRRRRLKAARESKFCTSQ